MTARSKLDQAIRWLLIGAAVLLVVSGPLAPYRRPLVIAAVALAFVAMAGYLLWRTHPAYTFSAAIVASMFSGNWEYIGIPGPLGPDRLLLVVAALAVLLRAPQVRHRRDIQVTATHWLMLLVIFWAIGSALAAGTVWNRGAQFEIIERLGILPFLAFVTAPFAFAERRHRAVLLAALVAMGAYLGVIALLEAMGLRGLVFPTYIENPGVGIHYGRARGPFLEAVTNGTGLFVSIIGALIACRTWRSYSAKLIAIAVALLCAAGMLFTETRSVWLGGLVAAGITMIAVKELRRWFIPAAATVLALAAFSLAVIPGLETRVQNRRADQETIYDRQNLNRAAMNMVEARPLVGFGWARFPVDSTLYFQQANYPLTGNGAIIHNLFLTYAAELGLIGLALWIVAVLSGVGGALLTRGPPEFRAWRVGLAAYAIFFLVVSNFVFPQVFPNLALWLLAGVLVSGGLQEPRRAWA